jgi:Flp pilus assembly pilin Flp
LRLVNAGGAEARRWRRLPGAPGKEEEMKELLKKLIADDSAQDMAEYGIALAVVGLVAALAALAIANNVGTLWSKANSIISTAAGTP